MSNPRNALRYLLPKIVSAFVGKTQLDGAAYTLPGSGDEGDSSGNVGQDRLSWRGC